MTNMTDEVRSNLMKSFTPKQKEVYDNLVGNEDRLSKEFAMCRKFYGDAIDVINNKDTGPQMRLFLRGISDYWQRRMKAMERSMEILCGEDCIRRVKNAKN